jgi:pimeloyl-ACP methyl ester carboxylesterase
VTIESRSPTVILVHGAFADASSWARVLERVRGAGIAVEAIPNPLRGLTFDGEYVASVLDQIDGPIVLVGHSYGGAVMTYASAKAPNVRALVYVASFGLDRGVSANQSVSDYAPPELASSVAVRSFPNGDEPGLEALNRADEFHSVFCADLPAAEAEVYGASQRPVAVGALDEPLAVQPGWSTIPSWFVIAGADRAINPDSQRAAAERMGAAAAEIDGGSHSIALSQPDCVAEVLLDAVRAIGRQRPAAVGAAGPNGARER